VDRATYPISIWIIESGHSLLCVYMMCDMMRSHEATNGRAGKDTIIAQPNSVTAVNTIIIRYYPLVSSLNGMSSPGSLEHLSDGDLNVKYEAALAELLLPAHRVQELIQSQTREKKIQTIQMSVTHASTGSTVSETKERELIEGLRHSSTPGKEFNIDVLLDLKTIISTAGKAVMLAFLEHGLLDAIAYCMHTRLARVPMRDNEAIQLFECLQCLKVVMNNALGMNAVIGNKDVFRLICHCLRFTLRPLALEVLEILSVSCHFSEEAASCVASGLRDLSTSLNEPHFMCLKNALICEDIEIKVSIIRFLNNLLSGFGDIGQRLSIRHELKAIGFDDVFSPLLDARVDDQPDIFIGDTPVPCKNDIFRTTGKSEPQEKMKTSTNMRRSSMMRRPVSTVHATSNDPITGIYSGSCTAVKNRSDTTAALATVFGSKQTKHRWYHVSPDTGFCWFEGDKAPTPGVAPRGSVPIASFVDIRAHSTDAILNKTTNFCFEVSNHM